MPAAAGSPGPADGARARSANPYVTLGIAMIAAMFDGYDGQVIGFLAPAIGKDWSLPRSEFGVIFSVGLVGLILGAMLVAPLADRLGRRAIAIAGATVAAAFTLLSVFAANPTQLALLRLMTGIGLGTLMPILVTIVHEAAPPRRSGIFVTFLVTAFPFGSALGGFLVAWGLQHGGWRDIFLASGLAASFYPILFYAFLWPAPLPPRAADAPARKMTVTGLFRGTWWRPTILLWILFFTSLLNIYTLAAWMPLLLERGGLGTVEAVRYASILGVGGTIGGILLGVAAERLGGMVLAIAYVVAAAALIGIGLTGGFGMILTALIATVGVAIVGGHVGNSVLAARIYPASMNATGVGWAQGLGRVGCVVGPMAVGAAVAANATNTSIFLASATVAVAAALAAFGLAVQARGNT
ncbi:MFS transporter [Sphingomonas oligophenolica]|uniref:MFS transporter n=1 Tax=Sphingomonas oligophenolica TaxID=301154 RepID=A0ABU9YBP1_9SPHN